MAAPFFKISISKKKKKLTNKRLLRSNNRTYKYIQLQNEKNIFKSIKKLNISKKTFNKLILSLPL